MISGRSGTAQVCCKYNIPSSLSYCLKSSIVANRLNSNELIQEGVPRDRIEKVKQPCGKVTL